MNRKRSVRCAALTVLFGAALSPAFGLEGTVVTDFVPTAALVAVQGPGSAPQQTEATRTTTQLALSDSRALAQNLSIHGTGWMLVDSLPTGDPTQVPPQKEVFSSRLLEGALSWQIVPGAIIAEMGKLVIHPSSGFFKTPLNLLSRGAAGNVPQPTPAASPQWEEGWAGIKFTWITGDLTLEEFFSPPMEWSADTDQSLRYVSAPQKDSQNQFRVEDHWNGLDLQLIELVSTGGPGSPDPAVHSRTGIGVDTNAGDSVTVHAEAALADSLDRQTVTNPAALTSATESVAWVPQAMAGGTWSVNNDVSLLIEYGFNGLGFSGSAYSRLLDYTKNRRQNSSAPDLAGQFGSFSAAQNDGFVRLSDNFTKQVTGQGWAEVNLQDGSGMDGVGLTSTFDHWAVAGSLMNTWGGGDTEAGVSPLLWQLDIELQFFF